MTSDETVTAQVGDDTVGAQATLTNEAVASLFHEIADVLVYLVRLAAVLEVDLDEALRSKLASNAVKYPVALARGNARKYSQL